MIDAARDKSLARATPDASLAVTGAARMMNVEREVKLFPPVDFELPDLSDVAQGIEAAVPVRRQLDAVYYDTDDLHLARSGMTLRYRSGESDPVWTLKLPESEEGPALARREVVFDRPPDRIPDEARDLVRAYVRSRPLALVLRMRTLRTAVELRDARGRSLVEVVDDEVQIAQGERVTDHFREIEVELRADEGVKVQKAAVAHLIAAGCRAGRPIPKAVRALGPQAQAPPEVVVPAIGHDPTMGALATRAVAHSVAQIMRHDPGVRLGEDPEHVHQFRVGARRLRSDLRTFAELFDADWVSGLRAELAWLGAEVGPVRDSDVLADRLRTQASTLPDEDATAVEALLAGVRDECDRQRHMLLAALRSDRYDTLVDTLVHASVRPPLLLDRATRPARTAMIPLVRRQWRRLARAADALGADPADLELHRVRILAKRCRYAAEAAAPAASKRALHFAAAIADVQTVLGDHQDAVMAEAWLRAAVAAAPDTGVAAGELIAVQRGERARLRQAWPAAWRTASAKKLRRWLH